MAEPVVEAPLSPLSVPLFLGEGPSEEEEVVEEELPEEEAESSGDSSSEASAPLALLPRAHH